MVNMRPVLLIVVLLVGLAACGTPEPQTVVETVVNTRIVEVEVPVTVEVEVTREIEVPVEVTRLVEVTAVPPATARPADVEEALARNYVGVDESGGIQIEIARVVIASRGYLEEIDHPIIGEEDLDQFDVLGHMMFKVTNTSDLRLDVGPVSEGTVQIGGEQIELGPFYWYYVNGHVDGEIDPGVSKIGGIWFGIWRSEVSEVDQLVYRADPPHDLDDHSRGEGFEIVLDLSEHIFEPIPDELRGS
jgi:hypothetical protein